MVDKDVVGKTFIVTRNIAYRFENKQRLLDGEEIRDVVVFKDQGILVKTSFECALSNVMSEEEFNKFVEKGTLIEAKPDGAVFSTSRLDEID